MTTSSPVRSSISTSANGPSRQPRRITLQYKQVTENAPTCIIILAQNRIVYANPKFQAFTGYEPVS